MNEVEIVINVLKEEVRRNNQRIDILEKEIKKMTCGYLVQKGRYSYIYTYKKGKVSCKYLGKISEEKKKEITNSIDRRKYFQNQIKTIKKENVIYLKMIKEGVRCLNK